MSAHTFTIIYDAFLMSEFDLSEAYLKARAVFPASSALGHVFRGMYTLLGESDRREAVFGLISSDGLVFTCRRHDLFPPLGLWVGERPPDITQGPCILSKYNW